MNTTVNKASASSVLERIDDLAKRIRKYPTMADVQEIYELTGLAAKKGWKSPQRTVGNDLEDHA